MNYILILRDNIKIKLLILSLFYFITSNTVDAQGWLWAKGQGGNINDGADRVLVNDDIYITGSFQSNPCYFNTTSIQPHGFEDMFVAKFSNTGDPKWVLRIGGYDSLQYQEG